MKIEVINGSDSNDYARIEIGVDGRSYVHAHCLCECPEDAMLERDLGFVYDIVPLMRMAHEAGCRGEPLDVIVSSAVDE